MRNMVFARSAMDFHRQEIRLSAITVIPKERIIVNLQPIRERRAATGGCVHRENH